LKVKSTGIYIYKIMQSHIYYANNKGIQDYIIR